MFGIPPGCQPQRDSIGVISVEFRAVFHEEFAIHVGAWRRLAGTPDRGAVEAYDDNPVVSLRSTTGREASGFG